MASNKLPQSPQRGNQNGLPPVPAALPPVPKTTQSGTPAPRFIVPPGSGIVVKRKSSFSSGLPLLGSLVLIGIAIWFVYKLSQESPVAAPAPVAQESKPEEPSSSDPAPEAIVAKPKPPPSPEELEEIVEADKIPIVAKPDLVPVALPSYNNFTYEQLRQATRDRVGDRRWEEHLERLTQLALNIIQKKKLTSDAGLFTTEFEKKILPYATVQIAFIRRIGMSELKSLSEDTLRPLVAHLFTNLPLLENFHNALSPQDNVVNAVRIWGTLSKRDTMPLERVNNENLAIALALVYDEKNDVSAAEKAFDFYREKQKKGLLHFKFSEVLPDELVWCVAPMVFSFKDYEWALKPATWRIDKVEGVNFRDSKVRGESVKLLNKFRQIHEKFERVAGAYPLIRYESNKPYPEYTMENILRFGGVCGNQTDFSVGFARAHGVPAANVGGEEPNGVAHAWCLFKGKKGWRPTGRQNADVGGSVNPQNENPVSEASFYLYDDPTRKDGRRDAALRLVRIANLLDEKKERARQLKVLEAAVHRCPGQPVFWEEWFAALGADGEKIPDYTVRPIIQKYRKQFKELPDFYHSEAIENFEVRQLFSQWSDEQVRNFMRSRRRQMRKDYPNRFDLILKSVQLEAGQLKKARQPGQIRTLLENVADDFGEKSLREFDRLFDAMEVIFKENDVPGSARHSVLTKMMRVFEKHHFSGKLNLPKLNPSRFTPILVRQRREKMIFEKFSEQFKELKAESLSTHAETKLQIVEKNIEGIHKIQEKIGKKMLGDKAETL